MNHNITDEAGEPRLTYDDVLQQTVNGVIDSLPERKHQSDQLLGSGRHWLVFPLSHEGKDYVLKVAQEFNTDAEELIKDSVEASDNTKDLLHFEKIAASSTEDAVLICERAEGEVLAECSEEVINSITDDQIIKFLEEATVAISRGVVIDPSPRNLIYDGANGFTAIDLSMKDNGVKPGAALASIFNSSGVDFYTLLNAQDLPSVERCTSALNLLRRVENLANKMPQIDDDFLRNVRQDIKANREVVENKARKRAGFLKRLVRK